MPEISRDQVHKMIARRQKAKNAPAFDPNAGFLDSLKGYIHQMVEERLQELKPQDGYTPEFGKDYMTEEHIEAFIKHVTPKAGKDYFTESEKRTLLGEITPQKGTHYFDGEDGRDGTDGRDGKDAEPPALEEVVGHLVSKGLLQPYQELATNKDVQKFRKKLSSRDILDFDQRLATLRGEVMRNYGGHGGTTQAAVLSTSDNQTFTLRVPLQLAELQIYRGGGRIFAENGDFTVVGDPVTSFTLSSALQSGELLNVLGKA